MTVHCGQTLTHSVKLANDLTDCPGDGLVIGAAGITVDLNSHTIDGVAPTSCDVPGVATAGVANRDGYDGVTVKDGAIRQFGFGVFANDMSDGVERGLTVSDSHFAALGVGGTRPVDAFGVGVLLIGASDTRVSRNTITDGGRGIGPGIGVGLPPEFGPSPRPVTGNVIERNRVSGQHADGIAVAPEARDTTLVRNTANGNAADGIRVLNPFTTITRNTANDNGAYGIEAVPGVADDGHNEASGNGNPAQCVEVACS